MKIEFKNGSIIEPIANSGIQENTRGIRSKYIYEVKLKYRVLWYIKRKWNGLLSGLHRSNLR